MKPCTTMPCGNTRSNHVDYTDADVDCVMWTNSDMVEVTWKLMWLLSWMVTGHLVGKSMADTWTKCRFPRGLIAGCQLAAQIWPKSGLIPKLAPWRFDHATSSKGINNLTITPCRLLQIRMGIFLL